MTWRAEASNGGPARSEIPPTLTRGLYAEVRGRLFMLHSTPGPAWWLRSWDPRDQSIGFQKGYPGAVYDRLVDPAEVSRVIDVNYRGVYRGLDVGVSSVGRPTIWVFTTTQEGEAARARGMAQDGRDGWMKEIPSDDPGLTVEQTVGEVRPPWSPIE